MTNYDLEEAKLIEIQIGLTLITVFTIIISLYLSYDTLQKTKKNKRVFNDNTSNNLLKLNRIIGIILAICFLTINIYDKNIKKKYNKDLKDANIQILAGILTLCAALLVLNVSDTDDFTSEENPEI